jgi:protein SCO1/2
MRRLLSTPAVHSPPGQGGSAPRGGALRAVLLSALVLVSCVRHESVLPKLFPVPDAALVDEHAKPMNLAQLKGYVTVYDFIFTNCAGSCPMMTATMRRLTAKVDRNAKVRFVSISVDPARDTPAVLHDYATKVRNDDRWIFLTGDRDTIVNLSVNGFKLAAGGAGASPNESILHSAKFAIADKDGMIREYYGAENEDAVAHVAKVVQELQ